MQFQSRYEVKRKKFDAFDVRSSSQAIYYKWLAYTVPILIWANEVNTTNAKAQIIESILLLLPQRNFRCNTCVIFHSSHMLVVHFKTNSRKTMTRKKQRHIGIIWLYGIIMTCIESALYYNLSSKYCENETPIANSGSLAINDHKKKQQQNAREIKWISNWGCVWQQFYQILTEIES